MAIRKFEPSDIPALQKAINDDQFHPGEWKVWHFQIPQFAYRVIEDSKGYVAFVIYSPDASDALRISCVWADANSEKRNAKAIFYGLRDAAHYARERKYEKLVIQTSYPKLANFLSKVFKMEQSGDDYYMSVRG